MTASERLAKVNRDISTIEAALTITYSRAAKENLTAQWAQCQQLKREIEAELQPLLWESEA